MNRREEGFYELMGEGGAFNLKGKKKRGEEGLFDYKKRRRWAFNYRLG